MIKVTKIKLKDGVPSELTLRVDAETAAKVAYLLGKLSHKAAVDLNAGEAYSAGCEVFDAFSRLFNGFYDDGIDEVVEGR